MGNLFLTETDRDQYNTFPEETKDMEDSLSISGLVYSVIQ